MEDLFYMKSRFNGKKTISRMKNAFTSEKRKNIFTRRNLLDFNVFTSKKGFHPWITFSDQKTFSCQKKRYVRDIHVKILKYHVNHASRKIPGIPNCNNKFHPITSPITFNIMITTKTTGRHWIFLEKGGGQYWGHNKEMVLVQSLIFL